MAGGLLKVYTNLPLAPQDAAALAPNGRVVVARTADYRIEWFAPGGRRCQPGHVPR